MRFSRPTRQLAQFLGVVLFASACGELLTEYESGEEKTGRSKGSVIQITAGSSHYCALLKGGKVRCWGSGNLGQLGYGNTTSVDGLITPAIAGDVDVGGVVTQISAGDTHTCALLSTAKVRCWGYANSEQLGYGNKENIGDNELPSSAGDIDLGGDAISISAGGTHTCALLATGNVRCWGSPFGGELGYPFIEHEAGLPPSLGKDAVVGGNVTHISAGGGHSCAILSSGNVRCWGRSGAGQLGYGNVLSGVSAQEAGDIPLGDTVAIQVITAEGITCALMESGAVRCWGEGMTGRLGYGSQNSIGDDELPNFDLSLGGKAKYLSASRTMTCAVLVGGDIKCWGLGGVLGYDNVDTIGDDEEPSDVLPIRIRDGSEVTEVASSSMGACVLLTSGHVRCWGLDSRVIGGDLCIEGNESSCPDMEPEPEMDPGPETDPGPE